MDVVFAHSEKLKPDQTLQFALDDHLPRIYPHVGAMLSANMFVFELGSAVALLALPIQTMTFNSRSTIFRNDRIRSLSVRQGVQTPLSEELLLPLLNKPLREVRSPFRQTILTVIFDEMC